MGKLVGVDGSTYSMVATRTEPAEVEARIESGWPVVTYFAGGRLVWHDEDDAWPAWADARSAPETVTGGRWESPDGSGAVALVFHAGGPTMCADAPFPRGLEVGVSARCPAGVRAPRVAVRV